MFSPISFFCALTSLIYAEVNDSLEQGDNERSSENNLVISVISKTELAGFPGIFSGGH